MKHPCTCQMPPDVRRLYSNPNRRWRAKAHVEPFHGTVSPYDGMTGTVVGEQDSFDRNGRKITGFILRLDNVSKNAFYAEVNFDTDHLERI